MYNAVPAAARAWRELLETVFAAAQADIAFIEHSHPLPIADLWARQDLACGFMCGWPFVTSGKMRAIAAPVPSPPAYECLPRYRSEFLVRAADRWHSLEETFGQRLGWMSLDSQSGFNAPRAHLAAFVREGRRTLFRESKGPLGSPMAALQALKDEVVDVIALDSYFLDLVRHHEPGRLRDLRSIDATAWMPIPLLVAAPGIDLGVVTRVRTELLRANATPEGRALLEPLLLDRFVAPDVAAYGALQRMARDAAAVGYDAIG